MESPGELARTQGVRFVVFRGVGERNDRAMLGFAAFAEALERRARARRFGAADARAFDMGFLKLPLCGAATSHRSQSFDAGFAFRASRCDEGRSLIPTEQRFHAQPQIVHVRIDCVKSELRTHDRDTSRPFTLVCTLERRLQTKAKRGHAALSRRNVSIARIASRFARLPTGSAQLFAQPRTYPVIVRLARARRPRRRS